MKKLLGLGAIIIIVMFLIENITIAAMQCDIVLDSPNTAEVKADDEFTVEVKVSNISSSIGLVTLGATLDYNENSLELVEMQGVGGYPAPDFNERNGKLLIDREPTNHNTTLFAMKFKVLNTEDTEVTLKNIAVSDGTGSAKVKEQSYTPNVKQEAPNPTTTPKPGANGDDKNNGNHVIVTDINDTTTKDEKLPQTGVKTIALPITGMLVVAIISFVKFKIINENMGM